jgi:hypothetical protein
MVTVKLKKVFLMLSTPRLGIFFHFTFIVIKFYTKNRLI